MKAIIPDQITQDLCQKAGDDVMGALQLTIAICGGPAEAATIMSSVAVLVLEQTSRICQHALDLCSDGKARPRDITRAELAAWTLALLRMAAHGRPMTVNEAMQLAARDVSLLASAGFPVDGVIKCECDYCRSKRGEAAHG